MSKDDRNTAIIVAVVLVVCTISLVVIGGYVWGLISPGLSRTLTSLGLYVKVNTVNYNFAVPKKETSAAANANTEPAFQLPDNYTYNFAIPVDYSQNNSESVTGIADSAVLSDAHAKAYGNGTKLTLVDSFITIPNLSIASPVYSGNVGVELNQGFWVYPDTNGQILMCQRQYFAATDKRSCWNLDKLTIGNEIFLERGTQKVRYVITDINTLTKVSSYIYGVPDQRSLQIVTSTPTEQGQDRLIITAMPSSAD